MVTYYEKMARRHLAHSQRAYESSQVVYREADGRLVSILSAANGMVLAEMEARRAQAYATAWRGDAGLAHTMRCGEAADAAKRAWQDIMAVLLSLPDPQAPLEPDSDVYADAAAMSKRVRTELDR